MERLDFECIDALVKSYKSCELSDFERRDCMERILVAVKPLIVKRCKYYFGYCDEDMIQDGYECVIRAVNDFDYEYVGVRFLGYLQRRVADFFWGKKKKELVRERIASFCQYEDGFCDECYEDKGFDSVKYYDVLDCLNDRERRFVVGVYLQGRRLKDVCLDEGISYAYGKEILSRSRQKLRNFVCI